MLYHSETPLKGKVFPMAEILMKYLKLKGLSISESRFVAMLYQVIGLHIPLPSPDHFLFLTDKSRLAYHRTP